MKNKFKYLIFSLFLFFIVFIPKCFAVGFPVGSSYYYVNFDTGLFMTIPRTDFSSLKIDNTHTLQDFFDDFVRVGEESNYIISIEYQGLDYKLNPGNRVFRIMILDNIPNNYVDASFVLLGNGSINYDFRYFINSGPSGSSPIYYQFFDFTLNTNNTLKPFGDDYTLNQSIIDLKSCLLNNNCVFSTSIASISEGFTTNIHGSIDDIDVNINVNSPNSLYVAPNNVQWGFSYIYWTNLDFRYKYSFLPNSQHTFTYKTLFLNNVKYEVNERVPTYCELYDTCHGLSNVRFVDYQPKLGTIYSSFSPNQLSTFNINLTFDTDNVNSLLYNNNLNYLWECYGRVDNNGYYSYEHFSYCDFENLGEFDSSGITVNMSFENFNIYDSNDNPITNLSRYDKIFTFITFQYNNDDLNKVVKNISLSSSSDFVEYADNFYGPIYERFRPTTLDSPFKYLISTNRSSYSYFFAKYVAEIGYSIFDVRYQTYNSSNFNVDTNPGYIASNFNRYSVNNSTGDNLMIFRINRNELTEDNLLSLDMVFFEDIIISYSFSSDNTDSFYYYDNTGVISSSNITVKINIAIDNNYDLSYYLNQVSLFIDDLSSSALTFALYSQAFYDNLPFVFQTFIFIIFILFCTYFVFILIKRK